MVMNSCSKRVVVGAKKLVISDAREVANYCYINDVITQATIEAHCKR